MIKHVTEILELFRSPEMIHFQVCQINCIIKKAMQTFNFPYIEITDVKTCKFIALVEDLQHVGNIARVKMAQVKTQEA